MKKLFITLMIIMMMALSAMAGARTVVVRSNIQIKGTTQLDRAVSIPTANVNMTSGDLTMTSGQLNVIGGNVIIGQIGDMGSTTRVRIYGTAIADSYVSNYVYTDTSGNLFDLVVRGEGLFNGGPITFDSTTVNFDTGTVTIYGRDRNPDTVFYVSGVAQFDTIWANTYYNITTDTASWFKLSNIPDTITNLVTDTAAWSKIVSVPDSWLLIGSDDTTAFSITALTYYGDGSKLTGILQLWEDSIGVLVSSTYDSEVRAKTLSIDSNAIVHALEVNGSGLISDSLTIGHIRIYSSGDEISNLFVGYEVSSLAHPNTATNNTLIGNNIMNNGVVNNSDDNIMIGSNIAQANTGSDNNIFIGDGIASAFVNGIGNVYIGQNVAVTATGGLYNTAVGVLAYTSGALNGDYNATFGYNSLQSNTTGDYNTALGTQSGNKNNTGDNNTFLGARITQNATVGDYDNNVMIGFEAARFSTVVNNCVIIGYQAGYNNTSDSMIIIGGPQDDSPLIWGDMARDSVTINGTLYCDSLWINAVPMNVPDYVFDEDYHLMPLNELRMNIELNEHLPNFEKGSDMKGWSPAFSMKLLKQVEENVLYILELENENQKLKDRVARLEAVVFGNKNLDK